MESNLTLVSPKPVMGISYSPNPRSFSTKQIFGLPLLPRTRTGSVSTPRTRSRTFPVTFFKSNSRRTSTADTSPSGQDTISVSINPQPYSPPPPSHFGSPLFWIGVGVGFSALFSFVAARLKKYAMQQAFKTVMGHQMGSQNNQFTNAAFPSGSPFGFPPPSMSGPSSYSGFPYQPPSPSGPSTSSGLTYSPPSTAGPTTSTGSSSSRLNQAASLSPGTSEAAVKVNVSATKSEAAGPMVVEDENEVMTEAKQSAFVDVSPEETITKSPFEDFNGSQMSSVDVKYAEVIQNGAAWKEATTAKQGKTGSLLSVEALEKMMEDPTVQKMVYPHLPEEMRNPDTFKWMLQNPQYRQQLQEMLDNMGGSSEWDKRMGETLKNFNFDNPEVKQQFDQLGLTPEEAISKIMGNPDVAVAFQNPRVQQAILDCSQNPLNITKYQHDEEVMSVFNKISQLFPGTAGPGGF